MSSDTPPMQPSTSVGRHRFHLLDGLRGIAAVIVALWHGTAVFGLKQLFYHGPLAVDFFFGLSGFVIAFSYEKRLQDGLRPIPFLIARVIRLYPICCLGMTCGFLFALYTHFHNSAILPLERIFLFYLKSLVLLPNLDHTKSPLLFPFDNAAWSLLFEVLANIIYAIVIYKRLGRNWVIGVFALVSCCLLAYWVHRGHYLWFIGFQNWIPAFLMGIPRVALSFGTGVLVLRVYRRYGVHWKWPSNFGPAISIVVAAALIFLLISPVRCMQSNSFSLGIVIFAVPLLVFFGSVARPPKVFDNFCSALGELSYPLYLLHMVSLSIASSFFLSSRWALTVPAAASILALSIALTSILSLGVAKWFDNPVRAFLTRKYNLLFLSHGARTRDILGGR